ncbi:MAG: SPFH domain-containing protein [Candidatus Heimdallarchaeota archaeon]|nr:SPFH domain-containing protein [Candidatus Heimdallarchaeota archaeon]
MEKVGVRSYEQAMIFKNGAHAGAISGGLYEIEKDFRNPSTEIIWFDTGELLLKFGVGHAGGMPPLTADEFKVGGNGEMGIKVQNAEMFCSKLVVGNPKFNDLELRKYINGEVTAAFRNLVNKYTLKNLVTSDKDDISAMFKAMTNDRLKSIGLEMTTMTLQGLAHPEENKSLVDDMLQAGAGNIKALMEEIDALKDRMKKVKQRLNDTDDKYLDGEIGDEEYNETMNRFKTMMSRYENDLKEKETELNNATKNKGVR